MVPGVAFHPHRGGPAPFLLVDLGDRGLRDRELRRSDEFIDPVGLALVEGVVDGGEEDLLWGELVVGLVADQFVETGGQVRDAQVAELLVVDLECKKF